MPRRQKPAPVAGTGPAMGNSERLRAMGRVASRITGFKPAKEVLTKVRAHPTIFPLYDRATKVGGHPMERISLIHGPSNHGKTAFVHGLGLSYLMASDFYVYVDAEYTTPEEWLTMLMADYSDHPGFIASRPTSYEDTVDSVRQALNTIAEAREKGELAPECTALVVVDSIQKLVPQNLMRKLLKSIKEHGLDGASGRGAMIKAAMNAQWLNELVPLLYHTKASMVFISREYEQAVDLKKLRDPGSGIDYKIGGGKGLIYESSLVGRVTRSWVKEGTGKDTQVFGERHAVAITKTKVGGKEDKIETGYFHTSNGILVPAGFDRARDVVELAIDSGHIVKSGAWLRCDALKKKWNGVNKAVVDLTNNRELLDTLEGEARA